MMGINKGFVVMMPPDKPKEEDYIVNNQIKFTLFNKQFNFIIQVKTKQE